MKNVIAVSLILLSAVTSWSQTTTWRAAENPHVVQGTYTVPAGQTLILEPGVRVEIRAASRLIVEGEMIGNGTAANRITFIAENNYNAELIVRGRSDLKFADMKGKIVPEPNSALLFADCTFSAWGSIYNGQSLQLGPSRAAYVQVDRSTFVGDDPGFAASLFLTYCTVVVRDTAFTRGSGLIVAPAYLYLDNITSEGARQNGLSVGADGDLFINNVTVTNAAQSGLALSGDTRNGTNVLLGPNVTLQNNQFPVHLTIAGLHKESAIPATGNRNNLINVSGSAGAGGRWPKFAIPYRLEGSPLTIGGSLEIDPGVVVKVTPYSYVNDVSFGDGMRAFGTKQNPITFERADPSLAWHGLHADRSEGGRLRHVIIDGSSDGVNGGEWRVENAIFRNNGIGTNGGARVSGSQYLGNATGHWTAGNLNSATNPNSFEGNQYGVRYSDDARNSWWGSPSGPTTPKNPGGTGDRIASELTQFKPFLTSRPNYNDAPPEVRMLRPHFQQDPGSKTTLRWESTDDGSIVSHKVLFSAVGNYVGSFQTVATLPGNQRSYEFTVPAIGFQVAGANSFIKVVAVDNTGKESFDEWEVVVPTNTIQGAVTFGITPGAVFEPGQELGDPADRSAVDPNMSRVESYIEVIGVPNRKMFTNGGFSMPFLSSDTVRFVESYGDTSNRRKYWYSPIFSVRPKASLGDAPPAIALVSPGAGASFGLGTVIPISWTASDNEGLRGFDIVASFDNARTWQPVVANLPGNARSYDWQMPPGSGFANVRVMVIAKDWRFQTSSAGRDRVFSTNSNNPSPTVANLIVNPTQIATGQSATGTVTLSQAAPAGGTLVTVSHDGQMFLTTPANITVPAGSSTGTFPVDTTNIAIAHTFQITATAGGVTRSAPLTVTLALTALDLPESAPSNSSVSGTVTLSGPAPAGGAVVNLSSTDPDVAGVPASVTIAEGAQSANFTTTTSSVTSQKSITISGEHAGTVKQTTISVAPAPVPVQFTAVSRKTHSGVGEIDLNLPLTGTPAIESRSGGTAGDHQIVITFSQPVSLTNANVTSGTGSVSGWSSDGAQVIVNLTGVANAQRIGVTLGGGSTAEYYVPMSVLAADTNGDGNVNSGDASQTRSRSGQAASSTNFRSDVNLDGNINSGDAIFVRSRSGTGLPSVP